MEVQTKKQYKLGYPDQHASYRSINESWRAWSGHGRKAQDITPHPSATECIWRASARRIPYPTRSPCPPLPVAASERTSSSVRKNDTRHEYRRRRRRRRIRHPGYPHALVRSTKVPFSFKMLPQHMGNRWNRLTLITLKRENIDFVKSENRLAALVKNRLFQ